MENEITRGRKIFIKKALFVKLKKKLWGKCILLILVLCMINSSIIPVTGLAGISTGAVEVQAAEVYKRFYFQGGLIMLPGTCISYTWTYMEKGDCVQFAVNGNGTMKVGICRMSDGTKFGVQRSGNFAVTMTVPSSGYYKVFLINSSSRVISFKGVAVCSR